MASGRPSSRRTTSATAARLASLEHEVRPLRAGAGARRVRSRPSPAAAARSGRVSSPGKWSRSRLVTTKTASGARSSQRPDRVRGVLHDLLEVVEDDQAATAAGDGVAELHAGVVLAERDLERGRDGEEDAVERARLGEIAEVDAARPVAEPSPAVAADETRLAGAPGTEHREQAGSRRRAAPRARAAPRSCRRRHRARREGCGGPRGPGARGRRRARRGRPCRHPPGERRTTSRARPARRSRPAPRCPLSR